MIPPIPLCWFKALTHLPCPTCGLTRGVLAALGGNFTLASQYHILTLPILLGGSLLGLLFVCWPRFRNQFWRLLTQWIRTRQAVWAVGIGLLLLWVYKLTSPAQYW